MKKSKFFVASVLTGGVLAAALTLAPGSASALWFNANAGDVFNTEGTEFTLGDDDNFGPAELGFVFPFFGDNQSEFFFNSNGTITFGGGRDSWDNYEFPRSGLDQFEETILPTIAPFFDDHDNSEGGILSIITSIDGLLVATWDDVPLFGKSATNSFQAVLIGPESPFSDVFATGTIIFNYGDLNDTGGTCDNDCEGLEGTAGFESSVGTATIGLNKGDGVNSAVLFGLGIGDEGGLITPADFAALENPLLDPFLFIPDGNGGYTVEFIPFDELPTLAGFTTNSVPAPGAFAIFCLGLVGLGFLRSRMAA